MTVWGVLLMLLAAAAAVPMVLLSLECLAAAWPAMRRQRPLGQRLPVAVLIPAHNEAEALARTLESIFSQTLTEDRVIVVAHNCDDETEEVGQRFGAETLQLADQSLWGKGHALDTGLASIAEQPSALVAIVDSGSVLSDGSLDRLCRMAQTTDRPVQGARILEPPPDSRRDLLLPWLAYRLKTYVRPIGLNRLGLPCVSAGSGVVIPWGILQRVSLATDRTAQDLRLSIDLALIGKPLLFCEQAVIVDRLPLERTSRAAQERRWVHGSLEVLVTRGPRLLMRALQSRRLDLLAFALDVMVPPGSLLLMLWAVAFATALTGSFLGLGWAPSIILTGAVGLLTISLLVAWARFCRATVPASKLLTVPLYVLRKLPLYRSLVRWHRAHWFPDKGIESR